MMHCGSCCDALWVTADAAAGARPGAATFDLNYELQLLKSNYDTQSPVNPTGKLQIPKN